MRRSLMTMVLAAVIGCAHPGAVPGSAAEVAGAPAAQSFPGAGPARRIPTSYAFESLEGPLWVAPGGYLLFSDVVEENGPAAKIYRYTPATSAFAVEPYPGSPISTNGLGLDRDGNLLACERWNGALVRISGGRRTVLADRYPQNAGPSLNAPNDLAVRADGNIYFTDTKWGARPGAHAAHAVYRIAPDGALSVAFAVSMPNGVAVSPDGATLYVGSDDQNVLWRLSLDASGVAGTASVFVDATHVPGGRFRVPDGICVDDTGALYVPNNSDVVKAVQVFSADGKFLGGIPIPERPSNCTFGGADRRTLFVTTLHAVYAVGVPTAGLP